MKPLLIFTAALALGAAPAAIAQPGHGHAPPGLAKKPHGMPPGQAKKMWRSGEHIPRTYYAEPRYYILEPARYRLAPPPPGYRWVVVEHDAYLVRRDNGLVAEVVADALTRILR